VSRCPNCGHLLDPGRLLTTAETARLCGVSPRTVEGWRRTWGTGLPVGRRRGPEPLPTYTGVVRYSETMVLAWLAQQVEDARARHLQT
jgi:transposase-like protein